MLNAGSKRASSVFNVNYVCWKPLQDLMTQTQPLDSTRRAGMRLSDVGRETPNKPDADSHSIQCLAVFRIQWMCSHSLLGYIFHDCRHGSRPSPIFLFLFRLLQTTVAGNWTFSGRRAKASVSCPRIFPYHWIPIALAANRAKESSMSR